jgi:phosphohistidine phosphatase
MSGKKTLFILRHAKSSWAEIGMDDINRSLKSSGIDDARALAKILKSDLSDLEIVLSSPANRAIHTAILFCQTVGLPLEKLEINDKIYEAHINEIKQIISKISDSISSAMIVGHNPTFTYFANEFLASPIDNLPTCGIVKVVFEVDTWRDIGRGRVVSSYFDYPKNHGL